MSAAPQTSPGKPLITANQVTLARMVLLPLPCAMMLYGGETARWWALVLYTILGITDFVDGQMARKYGPTVLGGLLDPVADKVFMAAAFMNLVAFHMITPAFTVAILFREFLITGLRSVMSINGRAVKTSVLGKIKTAVQMVAAAFVFIIVRLPELERVLPVFYVLSAGAAAFMAWRFWVTRKVNPLVVVPCLLIILALLVRSSMDLEDAVWTHWMVVLVFTWGSAADYLANSLVVLQGGGRMQSAARLVWSVAAGVVLPAVMCQLPEIAPVWVLLLGAELTSGAVDNLRCHEKMAPPARVYVIRGLVLLAGAAAVWFSPNSPDVVDAPFFVALGLAAVMVAWTGWDFWAARAIIWGEDAATVQSAQQSVSR